MVSGTGDFWFLVMVSGTGIGAVSGTGFLIFEDRPELALRARLARVAASSIDLIRRQSFVAAEVSVSRCVMRNLFGAR